MAQTILKTSAIIGGLGLNSLLQSQVAADDQFNNKTVIEDNGVFLGKPVKLRGSEPVNMSPITPRSDFEWVQNNGTDLKKVNINGVNRAPNVKLTMHTEKGGTFVGSGAFVGNSTILSVAHNFLGISPGTKVTRVTVTVGSNSDVDEDWNPTSGYSFDVDVNDIHFFDKQSYLKNMDTKTDTAIYDLAAIHTRIPYQLIVNKLKDQGVNLGTYNTLQLADSDEISRINNRENVLSGEHVRMYGYPGANPSDQVYFNPKLQQGYLYEVDTTVTNTETHVGDKDAIPVRFTKLRNTTLGGMSGSNLMNASGQVIGVHQSATNRNKNTDTPQNEKAWRATQMLLNQQHYQWLKNHINEDSQKGFVTFDGNRYYYDEDGAFLRNTTKEITDDGAIKVYQFDDKGIATEKIEVNEAPVDKVDVPTEKPVDKVDVPTEKPVDKVDVPAEKPVDKVDVPVEKPVDKVDIPAENPVDKVDVPAEKPVDKVDAPAEKPVDKVDAPAEKPVDKVDIPAENPADKVDVPAENPVDKVDVPVEKTISETSQEKIPYHTQIVKDTTLLKGERIIVQNGRDGVKNVIRTWASKNNQKSGDPTVTETIQVEALDEVIHIGTREDLAEINFENTSSGDIRAMIDSYSVAEGERVGVIRNYVHLLRPSNKVATGDKIQEKTEFAVRKLYNTFKSLSVRILP